MRGENDLTKATPAENTTAAPEEDGTVAYVDGSYHIGTKEFSCGAVLFLNGEELHFSERFTDPDLAEMRNVQERSRAPKLFCATASSMMCPP